MSDEELLTTIARLDAAVPGAGAFVKLGVEEGALCVTANRRGYLRLGVELLRAAYLAPSDAAEPSAGHEIDLDLRYLITADSDPIFGAFARTELYPGDAATPAAPRRLTLQERLVSPLMVVMLCLLAILPCLGLITLLRWLF